MHGISRITVYRGTVYRRITVLSLLPGSSISNQIIVYKDWSRNKLVSVFKIDFKKISLIAKLLFTVSEEGKTQNFPAHITRPSIIILI